MGERPLAGFSHGAAGIALALLRLHASRPEPAFLQAARDGVAFERAVFSPEERNWPAQQVTHEEQVASPLRGQRPWQMKAAQYSGGAARRFASGPARSRSIRSSWAALSASCGDAPFSHL